MRNVFKWHLLNQGFKFKIILQNCSSWCPLPKLLNSMATRANYKNIFEWYLYSHWPVHYLLINEDSDERSRALLLAHLSRRLMGELIVYQSLRRPSIVRPLSVARPSTISNIFSTYLTSRSNLLPNGKISEKLIFFKTVEALVIILTWYV